MIGSINAVEILRFFVFAWGAYLWSGCLVQAIVAAKNHDKSRFVDWLASVFGVGALLIELGIRLDEPHIHFRTPLYAVVFALLTLSLYAWPNGRS